MSTISAFLFLATFAISVCLVVFKPDLIPAASAFALGVAIGNLLWVVK